MGYFQVRYDSRVVIYNRRAFIRLATDYNSKHTINTVVNFIDAPNLFAFRIFQ